MGSSVESSSIISRGQAMYVERNFLDRTWPNIFKMPRTRFFSGDLRNDLGASHQQRTYRLAAMTFHRNPKIPAICVITSRH